jgi:hypothetical protein
VARWLLAQPDPDGPLELLVTVTGETRDDVIRDLVATVGECVLTFHLADRVTDQTLDAALDEAA